MGDNTSWAWAGACALGLGLSACGGVAIDEEDWAELEQEEAALYGESDQALMRVDFDLSAAGTGVFEPGDDPPPPASCQVNPIADVRAALGYRVLQAFGSTHPSVWECVPSLIAGCPSVRLSQTLRNSAVASGQVEALEQVQELLDALTELGGMPAFALAYQTAAGACLADPKSCSSTRRRYTFTPEPVNECGEVVFAIGSSPQTVVRPDTVGVLGNVALAKSPSPTTKVLGTGAAFNLELARATTTSTGPASPTPSSGTADAQVRRDAMGPYYDLYGGYRNPCRPGEGCTATGANTAIKTFLDQTCEASTATDACYHPTYDANYLAFRHNLTGFPGAVRKRIGEGCDYGPGSEIRDGELVSSPGRILALCAAQ